MRHNHVLFFVVPLLTTFASPVLAQQPADKSKDPNDPADQVTVHVVGGPGGGAGVMTITGAGGGPMAPGNVMVFPGPGGPGGPGGMMGGRDSLSPLISILGELNLAPDFNLAADQKQKIQSIRDEFKQAMDMWRAQNDDALKQLDEQQKELFEGMQNGNPPDPEQMQQLMQQRMQIMSTAPDGQDQATQLKAVLNADQLKQFEAKQEALEKERQEMMERMPIKVMGGPGMGGAPHKKGK